MFTPLLAGVALVAFFVWRIGALPPPIPAVPEMKPVTADIGAYMAKFPVATEDEHKHIMQMDPAPPIQAVSPGVNEHGMPKYSFLIFGRVFHFEGDQAVTLLKDMKQAPLPQLS